MSRPLRIEFPGAIYHLTSRGDRREPIFEDDGDRELLLDIVAQTLERFDAQMLAYCLMGNHYHFVLHTRRANLAALMQQLNGRYTQAYNRRHGKVGHLLQGRYKAVLVDRETYLFEVCRYVELNPVRARMVGEPGDWAWSSYRAHCLRVEAPPWLDCAGLHAYLLAQPASTPALQARAARRYAQLVAAARDQPLWEQGLRQQIYLGDEAFVARMQALAGGEPQLQKKTGTPKAQRQAAHPKTLRQYLAECSSREQALWLGHREAGLTMSAMARELGLSVARVSQLIKLQQGAGGLKPEA
ncbi:REP element-mobilizing transposase RayT [Inhella inkyongensis]|uniref:REP element-mobilizing transposase RayT n=1 Tax=Inhella inkyongensis TaxID=392593 RepID=A0A840S5G1_9BURK|nr:transposase [Inhella inkyongensis]MBB5204718.1 REP element-mobilizing transposase RayT [Inhella inkyongensis]